MTTVAHTVHTSPPSRLHAIVLCSQMPLFLGALIADIAYYRSYQIQWSNFASWLIAGALVFAGLALLFALVGLFRRRNPRPLTYFLLLLVTWVLGFINALEHAKDAWAVMPIGLALSLIVTLLAAAATWVGLAQPRTGEAR
ncbi:DUF2231 domain-containing protein [Ectopseudomonas guguanensis]|uniref:DUF2231 domain-containing protein n=1 Tax=Ectopseudomonas guguanensis TaxID=1198456 RepID=UPI00285F04AF|nr:DUF2231 domain-containing protein [Pseudomonas guguanensis]MDR8017587.1 DUF2231 domain-containing protein [Pseudomonas guguanensis]